MFAASAIQRKIARHKLPVRSLGIAAALAYCQLSQLGLGFELESSEPNRSRVIESVSWAPAETIIRRASGSDNWPITWADDDVLYTAYGDGRGFEPFVSKKLSLGLAKVLGSPTDFEGVNVRAPSIEATGDGVSGHKASGMLMVDGVLYMLVRNVDNARLAWSADRGANWMLADWKFTESFGAPSFINFGRNYGDSRDEFVYVVSHDADSAYKVADGCVLARVRKNDIRHRDAWRFFAGLADGRPQWASDVKRRNTILSNPGKCYRTSASYNAGIKRFLLVHPAPTSRTADRAGRPDTRFAGGLVVYDAPEPWGPWTIAYETAAWDVGPGETCSFPTKWISGDGRTMHLVFSGDDAFSVRRAMLKIANTDAAK